MTFGIAALLTVAMFGWQGVHLYHSFRNVDHKQSGDCPTRALEEVYFAAAHHADLIDDLEHAILVVPDNAMPAWSVEWRDHFGTSGTALDAAIVHASSLVTEELAAAVHQIEATSGDIETAALAVVDVAAGGDIHGAATRLEGFDYVSSRERYTDAVESMIIQSRRFFEAQLRSEHRAELVSVGVATGVFALAIGAWGIFLRQIKRGQRRLAAATERRRAAERELREAQKMEALGKMAAAVAHDIDNLLSAIDGSAEAVGLHLDEQSPALLPLATIAAATEQGNELVRGLMTFGSRAAYRPEAVDLVELTERTHGIVGHSLPASIEVSLDVPTTAGPFVLGDPVQLQQALMNLILNARDAMPDGGHLTVRLRRCVAEHGPMACIDVEDTGSGMAPEVQARIFEPFFSARTDERTGTGLGLAIVHGVVTRHGGEVRCVSAIGEGTTFTIAIPALPERVIGADPASARTTGARDRSSPPRRLRSVVLVAHRHRHVRELMAAALESGGYIVRQASDGSSLREMAAAAATQLAAVVLDVGMPGARDVACIRDLRCAGVTALLVALIPASAPAGNADFDDADTVFLSVPFAMADLVRLIEVRSQEAVSFGA